MLESTARNSATPAAPSFSYLKKDWPTPHVKRQDIAAFTQGMFSPWTLAAYDGKGKGPGGRFKLGHHIAYHVDAVIQWLETRSQIGVGR